MHEEFNKIGSDLWQAGLVTSHGGNLSVRVGDRLRITRRGAMLNHLTARDVIETGLEYDDAGVMLASSELVVHRAIYRATAALAVVHAHPPYTVALSLSQDELLPIDSEGSYLLHRVPVVVAEHTIGSQEVARLMAEALQHYKIVVLRGHGAFATGQFLEEAWQWTSSLEASCQIIHLSATLRQELKEYRRESDNYQKW